MDKERFALLKDNYVELITGLERHHDYSMYKASKRGTYCWSLYLLIRDLEKFELIDTKISQGLRKLENVKNKGAQILCVQIIKSLNLTF